MPLKKEWLLAINLLLRTKVHDIYKVFVCLAMWLFVNTGPGTQSV